MFDRRLRCEIGDGLRALAFFDELTTATIVRRGTKGGMAASVSGISVTMFHLANSVYNLAGVLDC